MREGGRGRGRGGSAPSECPRGVVALPSITSQATHYFHQTTMTNSSHLQLPYGKREAIYGASSGVSVLANPSAGARRRKGGWGVGVGGNGSLWGIIGDGNGCLLLGTDGDGGG